MISCKEVDKCFIDFEDKKKTLKDSKGCKSKLVIENNFNKKYRVLDIENCVYKNLQSETKCDYGFLIENKFVFLELKGSDVNKGVKQLLHTIEDLKHCFSSEILKARLIVSRFPNPRSTYNTKDYKDLVKIVNKELVITQNIHVEKI